MDNEAQLPLKVLQELVYGPISHLSDVPGLDLLEFQQQLFIAASLQLLYESPAVSRLREEHMNMSTLRNPIRPHTHY